MARPHCLADAGIALVARVDLAIEIRKIGLCLVEMANIMFGWIFRTALIEQRPDAMLESQQVYAFTNDIS